MPLIAGQSTLSRSLFPVDTGNGTRTVLSGDSLIRRSQNPRTSFGGGPVSTVTPGILGAIDFDFTMLRFLLAADVIGNWKWKIIANSNGSAAGRLIFSLLHQGAPMAGPVPAVPAVGPIRSLAAPNNTEYLELLHVRMPPFVFATGDRLSFRVELELTTAGNAGSVGEFAILHDPTTMDDFSIVEVNV